MKDILSFLYIPMYIVMFIVLYYQIFLLLSFFKTAKERRENDALLPNFSRETPHAPSVTIIVPCYNEEKTVMGTVNSLLNLNYPMSKLSILVVDDGSTDNTYSLVQKYIQDHPEHNNLSVITKPNGGKHTALNLALSMIKTDLVGCLDADSFADANALSEIVKHFEDKNVMAVIPGIKIHKPKTILQHIQKAEYAMGVFLKQALSVINGIHVTPGPLSIFRKKVFEDLGGYKKAHNTEDFEMAIRMQKNGYKIVSAEKAFVYTVCPSTLKQLIKQRVRWSQGFLRNIYEYRDMILNKKVGNLGILVLPMILLSIFISIYGFLLLATSNSLRIIDAIQKLRIVGWEAPDFSFKFTWFVFSANSMMLVMSALTIVGLIFVFMGRKMSDGKVNILGKDLWLFTLLYGFLAPLWLSGAVYEVATKKQNKWKN